MKMEEVINHGVPLERRWKIEAAARKFFSQEKEEKMKVRRVGGNPLGYYDSEHTKNVRDWKEVLDLTVEDPTLMWASHEPDDHELTEEACEEYIEEVQKLGYELLELISRSLGLPANRLNGYFKDQTSFLRLNHYPPCPVPNLALGVGRHKDAISLTILAQDDVGGLEVKRKTDGEYVWSNDKYESVEHRAIVNSKRERLSIPFFLSPSYYTMVKPLEELTDDQNPAKYREYSWGKFVATRKRSNLMKLNVENIQIDHFRV
ncbi:hypothetical protein LguiA_008887 [Lonicera macranthoides]